jgi:hypothetical protein
MDKLRCLDFILGVPLAGVFLYSGLYTVNVGVLFVSGLDKHIIYLLVTCCFKCNNRTLNDDSVVQVNRRFNWKYCWLWIIRYDTVFCSWSAVLVTLFVELLIV